MGKGPKTACRALFGNRPASFTFNSAIQLRDEIRRLIMKPDYNLDDPVCFFCLANHVNMWESHAEGMWISPTNITGYAWYPSGLKARGSLTNFSKDSVFKKMVKYWFKLMSLHALCTQGWISKPKLIQIQHKTSFYGQPTFSFSALNSCVAVPLLMIMVWQRQVNTEVWQRVH